MCVQVVIKKADGDEAEGSQEDTKPEVIDVSDTEENGNGDKDGSESPKKKPKVEPKKRKSSAPPKKEKKKVKKEPVKKKAVKPKVAPKKKGGKKGGDDDKEEKMKVIINVQQVRISLYSYLSCLSTD
jgi:hypothetical protein